MYTVEIGRKNGRLKSYLHVSGISMIRQSFEVNLSTLTTDTTGKLDVLWHDGDTFGVDGAQVSVFEETDEVSLRRLLESHNG